MNYPQLPHDPYAKLKSPPGRWLRGMLWSAAGMYLGAVSIVGCGGEKPADPAAAVMLPPGPGQALREEIEKLTGGHTRIVWVRSLGPKKDTFATGTQLALMGLDTRLASGEKVLAPGPDNFSRPLLSPDGHTVVFSRRLATGDPATAKWQSETFAADWTGGPPRLLRPGYAVEVWQDPQGGSVWVYAFTTLRDAVGANAEGYRLFRFPLAQPDKEEVVWEQGMMSGDNIQVNRAGTAASGLIPWPNAGTFDFTSGRFIRFRNGCWPALAPDDSGLLWVFDGTHENLRFFLPGIEGNWRVAMGDLPQLQGKAAYHPRWSNHARVISFTGPHPVNVSSGDGNVSVLLGRFNENLTGFEAAVSLDNASGQPDGFPDVWVAGGEKVDLDLSKAGNKRIREQLAAGPRPAAESWQADPEGLCFVWQRANSNNLVPGRNAEAGVTAIRHARFGPRFDMMTEGGAFTVDPDSAAAIREALAGGTWSMELAITPLGTGEAAPQVIFRAGPQLEILQSLTNFILRTDGGEWNLGAGLTPGQTTHLVLGSSGTPGAPPLVWLNGQPQEKREEEGKMEARLSPSDSPAVRFGSREDGSAPWAGRLENIAFHARAPDPAKAAAHAAWWRKELAGYTPPARSMVRARLKESSTRTALEKLGSYRRSWTSALYEKTALLSGPDPGPVFGVAHWTILDGQPLTGPPGDPGEERVLVLEPWTAHPEMESEHGSEEILTGDTPLFLDVGPPGS